MLAMNYPRRRILMDSDEEEGENLICKPSSLSKIERSMSDEEWDEEISRYTMDPDIESSIQEKISIPSILHQTPFTKTSSLNAETRTTVGSPLSRPSTTASCEDSLSLHRLKDARSKKLLKGLDNLRIQGGRTALEDCDIDGFDDAEEDTSGEWVEQTRQSMTRRRVRMGACFRDQPVLSSDRYMADDYELDDFIVASDEDEDEDEESHDEVEMVESKISRPQPRRLIDISLSSSSSSSGVCLKSLQTPFAMNLNISRSSGSGSSVMSLPTGKGSSTFRLRKRKRVVLEDDEDSIVEALGMDPASLVGMPDESIDDDDDSVNAEYDDEENVSGGDGEEDDEELEDGPMLYWQVNAMREQEMDEDDLEVAVSRKSYSRKEAMAVYIEMIGNALLDTDFLATCVRRHTSATSQRFFSASRQIENLISTSRESLLGSSAWQADFLAELQSRPFYLTTQTGHACSDRCDACGRCSQNVSSRVHLFGLSYDARRAWNCDRWDKIIPEALMRGMAAASPDTATTMIELSDTSDDDEAVAAEAAAPDDNYGAIDDDVGSDISSEDGFEKPQPPKKSCMGRQWSRELEGSEKESHWNLAAHCRARTQMYHTLLHYKFRLIVKIRERLESQLRSIGVSQSWVEARGSVPVKKQMDSLLSDTSFIAQEYDRLERSLAQAGAKWGEKEAARARPVDMWSDQASAQNGGRRITMKAAPPLETKTGMHRWLDKRRN